MRTRSTAIAMGIVVLFAEGALAQNPAVLIASHPPRPLSLTQLSFHGQGNDGTRYVIRINRDNFNSPITIRVGGNGARLGVVRLPDEEFPELDLAALTLGTYASGELVVTFRYGERREGVL